MKTLTIADFTGGLNTEQNAYIIKNNEAVTLTNFIVGINGIERRKGFQVKVHHTDTIQNGFNYAANKWIFVDDAWNVVLYDLSTNGLTNVGTITGSKTPKFAFFSPYVCIATGGSLWLYDTGTNTLTLTSSPTANDVVIKDGRVWIAGGDELWASRVGDPTDWTNDPADPSSAQYFQVGYKDGGEIIGFTTLFNDLIIFKDTGLYRFTGTVDDALISVITHKRTVINNTSYVSYVGDVVAVDKQSMYRISTVMKYGDLQVENIDIKVGSYLRDNYDGQMFYLPSIRAIALRVQNGFLLYFYQFRAWSYWSVETCSCLFDDGVNILGATERIYVYDGLVDDILISDLIVDATGEINSAVDEINYYGDYNYYRFNAIYKSKKFASDNHFLIKRIGVGYENKSIDDGDINLIVGRVSLNIPISDNSLLIYDLQNQEINSSTDSICGQTSKGFKYKRQIYRTNEFDVVLKLNTDTLINRIVVDYQNLSI